jgi:hypothetical protein
MRSTPGFLLELLWTELVHILNVLAFPSFHVSVIRRNERGFSSESREGDYFEIEVTVAPDSFLF